MEGTILFYDEEKGFGFIDQEEAEENIFFHITNCNGFIPEKAMRVQYATKEGRKGIEATNISMI